ncbi:MAG: hypothetical protein R6V44_13890 [Paracoccaceae bacterium]
MIPLSDAAIARLFLGVIALGFLVLTVWGFQIRAAAIHLERTHPDYFEALRRRSRRRLPRLAVVSELQTALFGKETIPEEVAADPTFARFLERERRLRNLFVPLSLVAFLIYALG